MEQEKFITHMSSAKRRQVRRAILDMGIDLYSKTSGIKPSDREALLKNLINLYAQAEITDMVNEALSEKALKRIFTGKSEKSTKLPETGKAPFLKRAETIFKRH